MKLSFKNLILGSGFTAFAISTVAGGTYILTEKLVDIAMNRKGPRIIEKSRLNVKNNKDMAELVSRMDEAEERLQNSGCETVEIVSHDGLKLIGHLHTCRAPRRIIVAMHGWRSSWTKDFGIISEFLHKNHCCVLYAEQRAHGESEGNYMSFGLNERHDCLAWAKWASERFGKKLPMYLCGISMGASTVLMTAGMDLPENVRGIIGDCGFTSPHDIWKHVVNSNFKMSYGKIQSMVADSAIKRKVGLSSKEYSTVDAMKECRVPVLFIHGTDDKLVPIRMTYENYKACIAPKTLLVVPGAEHGLSYIVDQKRYEEATLKFWHEND